MQFIQIDRFKNGFRNGISGDRAHPGEPPCRLDAHIRGSCAREEISYRIFTEKQADGQHITRVEAAEERVTHVF